MAEEHAPAANPDVHHEPTDIDIRGVFAFVGALIIAAVFIHFGVWLLFLFLTGREAQRVEPEYPLAIGQENRLPPEPRLQTNPREDLRRLREEEDAVLNNYGWADRNAGIARIPIGAAMKLTVERGLPVRQQGGVEK
jgi:hypothetical protein